MIINNCDCSLFLYAFAKIKNKFFVVVIVKITLFIVELKFVRSRCFFLFFRCIRYFEMLRCIYKTNSCFNVFETFNILFTNIVNFIIIMFFVINLSFSIKFFIESNCFMIFIKTNFCILFYLFNLIRKNLLN